MSHYKECPICGSRNTNLVHDELADDREVHSVRVCKICTEQFKSTYELTEQTEHRFSQTSAKSEFVPDDDISFLSALFWISMLVLTVWVLIL